MTLELATANSEEEFEREYNWQALRGNVSSDRNAYKKALKEWELYRTVCCSQCSRNAASFQDDDGTYLCGDCYANVPLIASLDACETLDEVKEFIKDNLI